MIYINYGFLVPIAFFTYKAIATLKNKSEDYNDYKFQAVFYAFLIVFIEILGLFNLYQLNQ